MKKITFNFQPSEVNYGMALRESMSSKNTFQCAPCTGTTSFGTTSSSSSTSSSNTGNLSFTWSAIGAAGAIGVAGAAGAAGVVARIAPAPFSGFATEIQKRLVEPVPEVAVCDDLADQYSVGSLTARKNGVERFIELFYGVAISNDVTDRTGNISKLLGPKGHYERLSFWSHFVGAFVFAIYATTRQVLARNDARLEGMMTSAAGWTISAVFLTSSIYHFTAPDLRFAMVTRVLDYAAIYIGITVATTADIAVATRGFLNVPVQTILDLPLAASLLILFFVWRRSRLPGKSTWTPHEITARSRDGCLLGRGLFSFGHRDLVHTQMRQATSLLLFANYFMSVPAAMVVLGNGVAQVVVSLQIVGFVAVTLGMAIDRVLEWPDGLLVEGSMTCLACPNTCGAVLNSHAVWHIVALLSAGLTVLSREYALAYS